MTVKVTQLFQATTVKGNNLAGRIAGWSESLYHAAALDSTELNTRWNALCAKRAALLPTGSSIIGQRVSIVDPVSGSRSYDTQFPGGYGGLQDLPQVALQFSVRSVTGFNQRQFELRGTPDGRVTGGEYAREDQYDGLLIAYFNEVKAGGWLMKAVDRTQIRVKILTITDAGICTCEGAHGLIVGDKVDLQSIVDEDGDSWTITAQVLTRNSDFSVTLIMPFGFAGFAYHKGRIRKKLTSYVGMTITTDEIVAPVAVTRKAGRPFRQFHGRQTARR